MKLPVFVRASEGKKYLSAPSFGPAWFQPRGSWLCRAIKPTVAAPTNPA